MTKKKTKLEEIAKRLARIDGVFNGVECGNGEKRQYKSSRLSRAESIQDAYAAECARRKEKVADQVHLPLTKWAN